MPRRVLDILAENFEVDEDVILRTLGSTGLRRLDGAARHSPPGLEGSAVCRAAPVARAGCGSDLRRDPLPGLDRPSSVRVVRLGRAVPALGGEGSARRRHQDDAVPDRPELAADRSADRSGGGRQAGGGARGAEGALRRAQQHHLGEPAGRGRHPRRLRAGEPEDALQAVPRGAPGSRRHPPLRAHRHGQLQPGDVEGLHRHRLVHRLAGGPRRCVGGVQLPDGLFEPEGLSRSSWWRRSACGLASAR